MNDMFKLMTSPTYTLRSESNGNLMVPKARTKLFEQSLMYSGAKIWNSLPVMLRSSQTLDQFKRLSLKFQLEKNID